MAFYKAELTVNIAKWHDAVAIIKARNFNEAMEKAKRFDFQDIQLKDIENNGYGEDILEYDTVEGIALSEI